MSPRERASPMFALVRNLSRHTIIYGIGSVAQSLIQFVLLPMYARVFTQEEYGVFALLGSLLAIGDIVFRSGLQFAFLTLYFHQPTDDDRRRLGRTAWSALVVQSAVLLLVLTLLGPLIARRFLGSEHYTGAVRLIFIYLFLATPTIVLTSVFRAVNRSVAFIAINVGQLAATLLANIVLVAMLRKGVTGALLGYALSAAVFGIASAVHLFRRFGFGIEEKYRRDVYRLGLSYALANILAQLLVYSNRWFLVAYTTLTDVAIYDLGYKVGMVLSLLVVAPFSVAWAGGLFAVAESGKPRETFANLFTYFLAILAWVALALDLFAREGILLAGGSRYAAALPIVPFIVTGYVLYGAYTFLTMGPALKKSSRELVATTLCALVTNALLNWLLIPRWGLMGAAVASLVSFGVLAGVMYLGAQRCYPVDYQFGRLAKLALLYTVNAVAGTLLSRGTPVSLALRAVLVLSFPLQLQAVSFFASAEWAALRRLPRSLLPGGAEAA